MNVKKSSLMGKGEVVTHLALSNPSFCDYHFYDILTPQVNLHKLLQFCIDNVIRAPGTFLQTSIGLDIPVTKKGVKVNVNGCLIV